MKKLAKILKTLLIILIGIQIAIFAVAENYGLINVDWKGFQSTLVEFMGFAGDTAANTAPSVLDTLFAAAPISGGFIGGFLLGLSSGELHEIKEKAHDFSRGRSHDCERKDINERVPFTLLEIWQA